MSFTDPLFWIIAFPPLVCLTAEALEQFAAWRWRRKIR